MFIAALPVTAKQWKNLDVLPPQFCLQLGPAINEQINVNELINILKHLTCVLKLCTFPKNYFFFSKSMYNFTNIYLHICFSDISKDEKLSFNFYLTLTYLIQLN